MPKEESKIEERGLERLIFFSDAVVAIAATLLVLPLTDLRPEEGQSAWLFLGEHLEEIVAFAISFAVILKFWFAHHRMFSRLSRADRVLPFWNTLWLAAVVFLPFPTVLLELAGDEGYVTLYLANLLVISICTIAMSRHIRAHPDLLLEPPSPAEGHRYRLGGLGLIIGVSLALVASLFFERGAMLLLLLIPVMDFIVSSVANRRQPST